MSPWTYYLLCVLVLTALLFWPVAKLVWVMSVRRLERRLGQALSDDERAGQANRARFIAILLCVAFSAMFNYQLLDMSTHG